MVVQVLCSTTVTVFPGQCSMMIVRHEYFSFGKIHEWKKFPRGPTLGDDETLPGGRWNTLTLTHNVTHLSQH